MKKFLLSVFVLFSLTGLTIGQTIANWNRYTGKYKEFSADLPNNVGINASVTDSSGLLIEYVYGARSGDDYFHISVCPSVNCGLNSTIMKVVKSMAKDGSANYSETATKVDNFDAQLIKFKDPEGYFNTIKKFKTDKRLYIIHAVSPVEANTNVEQFFEAFSLDITKKSSNVYENRDAIPGTPDNAPSNPADNKSTAGQGTFVPLKILKRPFPKYTELAGLYHILGTIKLRVVFQANGQIGTVEPLNKYPFGLTSSAITAAKGLTFIPASKDGVPQDAVRIIEYSRTLY